MTARIIPFPERRPEPAGNLFLGVALGDGALADHGGRDGRVVGRMTIPQKETAASRAQRLLDAVSGSSTGTYTKGEVKTMLNSIATVRYDDGAEPVVSSGAAGEFGCRGPAQVASVKRGDVFIAGAFGGKVRPWVVLRATEEAVVAMPLSSSGEDRPWSSKSECRLWPGCTIGAAFSSFPLSTATREVTRPYTNARHLRAVERAAFRAIRSGSSQ